MWSWLKPRWFLPRLRTIGARGLVEIESGEEMPLTKMITVIGNSQGVILDKPLLRLLGWDENTWVTMRVEDDRIVVRPATKDEALKAIADGEASGS